MNDAEVVKLCLARDKQTAAAARNLLVSRYWDKVTGLVYRVTQNVNEVEDLAQEVFIRVFQYLEKWDSERPFTPWILQITGNRCKTWLVKRKKYTNALEQCPEPMESRPHDGLCPEWAEEYAKALEQLRAEYRLVFVLFHEEQLEYEEIAASLQIPVGTVKTWLYRARAALMDIFRERELAF